MVWGFWRYIRPTDARHLEIVLDVNRQFIDRVINPEGCATALWNNKASGAGILSDWLREPGWIPAHAFLHVFDDL